uniref:Uncharacterized protein n=1 Tax=Solanum lycopersicum TaxID=4081 RepID=K4BEZ1_SOLLC
MIISWVVLWSLVYLQVRCTGSSLNFQRSLDMGPDKDTVNHARYCRAWTPRDGKKGKETKNLE